MNLQRGLYREYDSPGRCLEYAMGGKVMVLSAKIDFPVNPHKSHYFFNRLISRATSFIVCWLVELKKVNEHFNTLALFKIFEFLTNLVKTFNFSVQQLRG